MALDKNGNIIPEYKSYTYIEKEIYGLFNHPECNCLKGMHLTHIWAIFGFISFVVALSQINRLM